MASYNFQVIANLVPRHHLKDGKYNKRLIQGSHSQGNIIFQDVLCIIFYYCLYKREIHVFAHKVG